MPFAGERLAGALQAVAGLVDDVADALAGLRDHLVEGLAGRRAGALEAAARLVSGLVHRSLDGAGGAALVLVLLNGDGVRLAALVPPLVRRRRDAGIRRRKIFLVKRRFLPPRVRRRSRSRRDAGGHRDRERGARARTLRRGDRRLRPHPPPASHDASPFLVFSASVRARAPPRRARLLEHRRQVRRLLDLSESRLVAANVLLERAQYALGVLRRRDDAR